MADIRMDDAAPLGPRGVPVRMNVFATREVRLRGRRPRVAAVGWQAWHDDPVMEARDGRLRGAGSF